MVLRPDASAAADHWEAQADLGLVRRLGVRTDEDFDHRDHAQQRLGPRPYSTSTQTSRNGRIKLRTWLAGLKLSSWPASGIWGIAAFSVCGYINAVPLGKHGICTDLKNYDFLECVVIGFPIYACGSVTHIEPLCIKARNSWSCWRNCESMSFVHVDCGPR